MLLYLPALVAAFVITLIEMTEVVALVFALSAEHGSIRSGTAGAVVGTAVVAAIALAAGAVLIAFPRWILLWAAAVVLVAFGFFLLRSTLRTYRKLRIPSTAPSAAGRSSHAVQFAGGFSVGAVETLETVIVLIALAAAGYGGSAILGAVAGGVLLVGAAAVLHEQVRRIKIPLLKLVATALLFSYAVFWGGEAAGVSWPGADLILIPMSLALILLVRAVVDWRVPPPVLPVGAKG
ncbi:MAG: hypothetical protein L3K19_04990 [Thermoplasmata archaeon]|nr:hypothetical protein [Thermoplasmata archaeon]